MDKQKLKHNLAALVALIVALGPTVIDALADLPPSWKWVKPVGAFLGVVVGLCTSGKAVAIVGALLPDAPESVQPAPVIPIAPAVQAGTTPTPVTAPATPSAIAEAKKGT